MPLVRICFFLSWLVGFFFVYAILKAQPGVDPYHTLGIILACGAVLAAVGPFINTFLGSSFANSLEMGERAHYAAKVGLQPGPERRVFNAHK